MSRQRITPGTVGPASLKLLGMNDEGKEVVIPKPVVDGEEGDYPRLRMGQPVKIERPDGIREFTPTKWQGEVRAADIDGGEPKRIRAEGTTKAAASAAATRAGMNWLAGQSQIRAASAEAVAAAELGDVTTTVGDLVLIIVDGEWFSGLAAKTQQDYRYAAAQIATYPIAGLLPRNVDVAAAKAFLNEFTNDHGTGGTRHARSVITRSLGLAVDNRTMHVAMNPFNNVGRTDIAQKSVRPTGLNHKRSPTTAEMTALLENLYADPAAGLMTGPRKAAKGVKHVNGKDIADLVSTLFALGCRIGEGSAIRWTDIDFVGMNVSINGTVKTLKGLGTYRQPFPKTKAGVRLVPINDQTAHMIRTRAAALGIDLTDPPASPVFGTPQFPDRFREQGNLATVIRVLFTKHGLPWGRAHIGRKWRITDLHEKGIDDGMIRDLVGHKSIATTQLYVGTGRQDNPGLRAAL